MNQKITIITSIFSLDILYTRTIKPVKTTVITFSVFAIIKSIYTSIFGNINA